MKSPPRTRIATALGTLSVRQAGAGDALLLLHGIGGNSAVWEEQFDELSSAFRVIAWDAPGYGESDAFAQASPALSDYANAAMALLDALQIRHAMILGQSMGALIAACIAATHGARVTRLVLCDATSGYRTYDAHERERLLATRLDPRVSADPLAYARQRAPQVLAPNAAPELVERAARFMAQLHPRGYQAAARMLGDADIFGHLPHIQVPTLVLCGTEDRVTPEALNRRIAEAIAGAQYRSIAAAGHWTFLEQPAQFNRAVMQFLRWLTP